MGRALAQGKGSSSYVGPRWIDEASFWGMASGVEDVVLAVLDAMDGGVTIVAVYDGFDREVVPVVVGASSLGEPLVRVVQVGGFSRSGHRAGWRVMRIRELSEVSVGWSYGVDVLGGYDPFYPWVYYVYAMVQ